MIVAKPKNSPGTPRADVICDECPRIETVPCDYERKGADWLPNEGQILGKMQGKGWATVKGKLYCPACEAKRKAEKETKPMAVEASNVTQIREPTPKQKRLIIMALEDDYDDQAKRYRGGKTDKTIADDLGDGIMFGWVTKIREELFGPDGANEEIEKTHQELIEARRQMVDLGKQLADAREAVQRIETDFTQHKARIDRATARIGAIKDAVGPKVAAV